MSRVNHKYYSKQDLISLFLENPIIYNETKGGTLVTYRLCDDMLEGITHTFEGWDLSIVEAIWPVYGRQNLVYCFKSIDTEETFFLKFTGMRTTVGTYFEEVHETFKIKKEIEVWN